MTLYAEDNEIQLDEDIKRKSKKQKKEKDSNDADDDEEKRKRERKERKSERRKKETECDEPKRDETGCDETRCDEKKEPKEKRKSRKEKSVKKLIEMFDQNQEHGELDEKASSFIEVKAIEQASLNLTTGETPKSSEVNQIDDFLSEIEKMINENAEKVAEMDSTQSDSETRNYSPDQTEQSPEPEKGPLAFFSYKDQNEGYNEGQTEGQNKGQTECLTEGQTGGQHKGQNEGMTEGSNESQKESSNEFQKSGERTTSGETKSHPEPEILENDEKVVELSSESESESESEPEPAPQSESEQTRKQESEPEDSEDEIDISDSGANLSDKNDIPVRGEKSVSESSDSETESRDQPENPVSGTNRCLSYQIINLKTAQKNSTVSN